MATAGTYSYDVQIPEIVVSFAMVFGAQLGGGYLHAKEIGPAA